MALSVMGESTLPVDAPVVHLCIAHKTDGVPEMLARLPGGELAHVHAWTDLGLYVAMEDIYRFTLGGLVQFAEDTQ